MLTFGQKIDLILNPSFENFTNYYVPYLNGSLDDTSSFRTCIHKYQITTLEPIWHLALLSCTSLCK